MDDKVLQRLALDALDPLLEMTQERLLASGYGLLPRPELHLFRHRLDAGRAIPPKRHGQPGIIELNAVYLEQSPEAMLADTLPHELAHLVAWHLIPGQKLPPHGPLWQTLMRDWYGVEPRRTHDFDSSMVASRRQRRWPYRCDCSRHELSTTRHRRAERGARYHCRKCGKPLRAAD